MPLGHISPVSISTGSKIRSRRRSTTQRGRPGDCVEERGTQARHHRNHHDATQLPRDYRDRNPPTRQEPFARDEAVRHRGIVEAYTAPTAAGSPGAVRSPHNPIAPRAGISRSAAYVIGLRLAIDKPVTRTGLGKSVQLAPHRRAAVAMATVVVILGTIGYTRFPHVGLSEALYRLLGLFTLATGTVDGHIPISLQIASSGTRHARTSRSRSAGTTTHWTRAEPFLPDLLHAVLSRP